MDLKNILVGNKIIVMSWICFVSAMVLIFTQPDRWELEMLLLSFSFFPNLIKEFIKRKYGLAETETKNEGDK